jgi:hypothetical protein
MIAVDDASGTAIALARGRQHHQRCCEGEAAAPCWGACRHSGRAVLLGRGRIEHVGQPWLPSSARLGIRRRREVPWPASLAGGPYGWAQIATFVITGLLIMILALAGVALILAAFRVDVQPQEKAGPGRLQPAQT